MNLKTKVLGLVAATALSLGIVTGVSAQVGSSVTLTSDPCTVGVSGAAVDFGTYKFNPNSDLYELSGSAGNTTFTVESFNGSAEDQTAGCDAEITATPLTNPDDADGQIHVALGGTVSNVLEVNVIPGTDSTENVNAALNSSLLIAFDELTYSGTIQVSSDNAAN